MSFCSFGQEERDSSYIETYRDSWVLRLFNKNTTNTQNTAENGGPIITVVKNPYGNKVSKKMGHEYGVRNCIKICENLKKLDFKINEISFYVFSTENWKRRPLEVRNLFKIIEAFYASFKASANKNNISKVNIKGLEKASSNGT